jgi:hypothetical protein
MPRGRVHRAAIDALPQRQQRRNIFHLFPERVHKVCVLSGMPSFYYDLIVGRDYRDQGCVELKDCAAAIERADELARDFLTLRPELTGHGAAVRCGWWTRITSRYIVRLLVPFQNGRCLTASKGHKNLLG